MKPNPNTTKGKKGKYRIVYLVCGDASSMSKWSSETDIDEWLDANEKDSGFVKSVGWLLRETKKYIIIGSQQAPETDWQDLHWSSLQKIPKSWIKERKILL